MVKFTYHILIMLGGGLFMYFYISLALGIISLGLFLVLRKPEVKLKALFSKSVTSVMFITTAVAAFYENENCPTLLALLFVVAGVFGLLGDVWLDMKYLTKEHSYGFLKAGFIFFLVGHIFYSVAVLLHYEITKWILICSVIGLIVSTSACVFTEKLFKANYGKAKLITIVYTAVLGITTGIYGGVMIGEGFDTSSVLRFAGMVFFLLSDAVLAKIYFCKDQATQFNITLNHFLYYVAQFSLAISLLFA